MYVAALWYWGAALAKAQGTASPVANLNSHPEIIAPLCLLVACLMWGIGVVLFIGLPPYYHQAPGHIPSFYASLFRRKVILVRSPSSRHIISNELIKPPVVLRRRRHTKLLALSTLRPELDLSMVKSNGTTLANRNTTTSILHSNMDHRSIRIQIHLQQPLLGPPSICNGSRCSTLGTNPLEYFEHGPVSALDIGSRRKCFGRPVVVVMAWSVRRRTRCRYVIPSPTHYPLSTHAS